MASDGQIVFEVTADGKHAIADIKDITRAIQQESGKWDDAAKESTNFIEKSFNSMLKKVAAGFSAVKIGKALLDFGKDALQAASALEEVQNVVDVTFGSNAGKIDDWAKQAGTQFGLTETQAKKFTSTLGAMMKSSGVAGNEITQMSTDLAGLAADMASFYNLDFEEAFQKIRSGISGETEPLKQLGINMSVANLEAYALSKGIDKAFNEMSQGEQTMLRYQYLMSATADAQGDFARTSDGYANSMRQLETNIESIKTALGATFINVMTQASGLLSGFLQSLIPGEKQTTVLDDFASIDLKTEEKLAKIRQTAEEAKLLTETLNEINGTQSTNAGGKIQDIVNDLANINLNQEKANIVKDFVASMSQNIGALAAVQGTDAQGASEWLSSIAQAANELDPNDVVGWATLVDTIKEGLPGLEGTPEGAEFLSSLSGGLAEIFALYGVDSQESKQYLDSLGLSTDEIALKQGKWLETCKRLVQTLPGLNSIINTETGEVKGGTQAIEEYITAWENGQTRLALLGALDQKEAAYNERFSNIPGLELDVALDEKHVRDQRKKIRDLFNKYGIGADQEIGYVADVSLDQDAIDEINAEVDSLYALEAALETSRSKYEEQKAALEEAKIALKEYREAIEEQYGSMEEAEKAGVEWSEEMQENAKLLADAALLSLKTVNDYAKGVRDSVLKSIDSVVHGFDRINYKRFTKEAYEDFKRLSEASASFEVGSQEWKDNEAALEKYNKELITTNTIYSNLESQAEFLQSYLDDLSAAQSMGLSDALLASLSDGSVESAQILNALVNDKTGKTAAEIDKLFGDVQAKKAELADSLTGQQLSVDETYQGYLQAAQEAVAALDMEQEAGENSGKTAQGIIQGLESHVPGISDAVNDILNELDKLNNYTVHINTSGLIGGLMNFFIPQHETGLDVVPFDGYLASLHAGEGILTAEENKVWQRFKNGGVGTDYETMGSVMRDNIKPGGNVYLDGRVVGNVVSDMQGKSYRQLTRSGWQG